MSGNNWLGTWRAMFYDWCLTFLSIWRLSGVSVHAPAVACMHACCNVQTFKFHLILNILHFFFENRLKCNFSYNKDKNSRDYPFNPNKSITLISLNIKDKVNGIILTWKSDTIFPLVHLVPLFSPEMEEWWIHSEKKTEVSIFPGLWRKPRRAQDPSCCLR